MNKLFMAINQIYQRYFGTTYQDIKYEDQVKLSKEIISLVNAHQVESNFKCIDCQPVYTLECPMAIGYLSKCDKGVPL